MAVSESGESDRTESPADPEPERRNESTATSPLDAFGRWVRIAAGLAGVAVFGLAVTVTVAPGALEPLVESAIERVGNDYFVVAAIGIVALWLALLAAALRGITGTRQSSPPAVEGVQTAPPPGAAFDDALEAASGPLGGNPGTRRELEDRLQNAAVETLMRVENCSRPAAERRLEADERYSALTAGLERGGSAAPRSTSERLVDAVRGKTASSDDVAAAVRELEHLSERGPTSEENDRRDGGHDEERADRTESDDPASKRNSYRDGDGSSVPPDERRDAVGP